MLVLARVGLVFFIAASMSLCFGFLTKTVLTTQACFSNCWAVLSQPQAFPVFHASLSVSRLKVGKRLRGDTDRTADQRDIPCDIVLSNESWGEEEEARDLQSDGIGFPSNHCMWWSPGVLEVVEHLPAHGKQWVNSLFCFACVLDFCFTSWTLYLSLCIVSLSALLIIFPIPLGGLNKLPTKVNSQYQGSLAGVGFSFDSDLTVASTGARREWILPLGSLLQRKCNCFGAYLSW